MRVFNEKRVAVSKGVYQSYICDDGKVEENFEGAAVKDGCFCKYYKRAMNWESPENERDPDTGYPYLEHYCSLNKSFMGFSHCCWSNLECFEKGDPVSNEVVKVALKIKADRIREGMILG